MKDMTPEFDSRIADWLEDDPDKAPSIVLETVVGALPSIPQRRTWRSLLRSELMPRFSIAAAAILVAAVGFSAWIASNRGGIGGVPPTPAAPTQTPLASPRVLTGLNQALELPAGSYRAGSPFSVPLTFSVSNGNWLVSVLEANVFQIVRRNAPENASNWLTILRPEKVYDDPCHNDEPIDVGDSVDDLVEALRGLPGFTAGPVSDVTVGDASGKSFTLENSIDPETEDCHLPLVTYDRFGLDDTHASAPDDHNRIWVLEHSGALLLIDVLSAQEATPEGLTEAEEIVESITFD